MLDHEGFGQGWTTVYFDADALNSELDLFGTCRTISETTMTCILQFVFCVHILSHNCSMQVQGIQGGFFKAVMIVT